MQNDPNICKIFRLTCFQEYCSCVNNKTPFDVFTWQPLTPLKTDPGQRTEKTFPYFTGKQVEEQNSSDGARKGT